MTPRNPAIEVRVYGNRDPRGPDNNVQVWLDTDDDTLHIRVYKAERCYRFKQVVETSGHVEVIAE